MAASTDVTPADAAALSAPHGKGDRVAALTGLRGLAALAVVLVHTSGRTEYPWLGVVGFGPVCLFLLSGFLLYRPWAKWTLRAGPRPSVLTFARHRVARIFPAFWLVLVVIAVVYPPSRPLGTDGWWQAVLLGQIYSPVGLRPGLEHIWSLGTEVSWYLALPVLALLSGGFVRRLAPRTAFWTQAALIGLALPVSAAWRWAMAEADLERTFTVSFWLPAFLFCFAAGALVAHLLEGHRAGVVGIPRVRALAADQWTVLAIAVGATLVATSSLSGPDGFLPTTFTERQTRTAATALLAVALLFAAALGPGGPVTRALSVRWLTATGRWSYGLFLWHLPVIEIMDDRVDFPSGPAGLVWRLVLLLLIAIPLSAATYTWVEQPAINWSRGTGVLGRRDLDRPAEDRPATRPATASRSTPMAASAPIPVAIRKSDPGS